MLRFLTLTQSNGTLLYFLLLKHTTIFTPISIVMKKFFYLFISFLFFLPLLETANAQWSVGATYEYRNEDPNNGFGLRVEKGVLEGLPILDLNLRGHFSYFNETTQVSRQNISFSSDLDVYDFGLAALVGVSIGLVTPYVGAGIGNERFKLDTDLEGLSFKERNFYWNGFAGAEVEILPYLKPFIEFRAGKLTSTDEVEVDNINRLAIGLIFRF